MEKNTTDLLLRLQELSSKIANERGWPMDLLSRHSYLTLESSEFVEASRGKNGNPTEEAGDIMITALLLIDGGGVDIIKAMTGALARLEALQGQPTYPGELTIKPK